MASYKIELTKGAVRDLKKMEPALRDFMYNRISELGENPNQNEQLSGSFKELRSQHSKFRA